VLNVIFVANPLIVQIPDIDPVAKASFVADPATVAMLLIVALASLNLNPVADTVALEEIDPLASLSLIAVPLIVALALIVEALNLTLMPNPATVPVLTIDPLASVAKTSPTQ
jgi:hypothetical protein